METLPDRHTATHNGKVPPERQLKPGRGNLGRITDQTRGLVDDLTAWVELRLELAQLEVEERIERKVNDLALKVIFGGLAGLAGLFALVTLALALGAWLGHPAWGYLIVTGLLALAAVVVRAAHPRLIQMGGRGASGKQKRGQKNRSPTS